QPLWDQLHILSMPVLVVTGENDQKFTALGRRLVDCIGENARHVEVPGAGHAVPLERSTDFAALLSAFLR
ncbi:MAG: alpha/beta fold hydrolase, partial [Actinomycetota bacterium]